MEFCQNYMQPTQVSHSIGQTNVGTATCHIRSDGDRSRLPCAGDNFGFKLVLMSIEHHMLKARTSEPVAQELRRGH
jgi:hypothetical protein